MMQGTKGVQEFLAALKKIQGELPKKVQRPAMSKALTVFKRAMKAEVPANLKDLKRTIGSSFKKPKSGPGQWIAQAKVGAGVGVKRRGFMTSDRTGKKGVGIGLTNTHWFLLGTGERKTGFKTRKTKAGMTSKATGNKVRRTGRMPAQTDAVKRGFQKGTPEAMAVMKRTIAEQLEKLATRARR